jgi:HEPN domain-containing protein
MARKRFPPDDYREWLNRAAGNLARAKSAIPEAYLEDLCFDAQQSAEKAIKAVFVHNRIDFPFIHDLTQLLTRLADSGIAIPEAIWHAGRLSKFAVLTRYPEHLPPVSKRQYLSAIRIAAAVLRWAERQTK